MRSRLDRALTARKLALSRSQAENYIRLGLVRINGKAVQKSSILVDDTDELHIEGVQYVSRAALKLASVADVFGLQFNDKVVLDVGSSTGGFTDYALQHGAKRVIAVDVGTKQLHHSLIAHPKIELHEKTDIRHFNPSQKLDVILIDVSFISLTYILPHVQSLADASTELIVMCKPQFEAGRDQIHKGVIKNSAMRRDILKKFETWLGEHNFTIVAKADSQVSGTKGNVERFYKLVVN